MNDAQVKNRCITQADVVVVVEKIREGATAAFVEYAVAFVFYL
jgi:hypothetical protein